MNQTTVKEHKVSVNVSATEELCINKAGETPCLHSRSNWATALCRKNRQRLSKMLGRSGDVLRIEWGYFYLCGPNGSGI